MQESLIYKINLSSFEDFSNISYPNKVEILIFNNDYNGEMPELYDFINLRELYINVPTSIRYLSELKLDKLRILSFTTDEINSSYAINFPNLESLSINDISKKDLSPLEKLTTDHNRYEFDISKLNRLEALNLYYCSGLNFNTLAFPKNLRKLKAKYCQINDISWCFTIKKLNTLILSHNNITNINGITNLQYLEYLDLSYNDINDFSYLKSMDVLSYARITMNPIKNEDELRELRIKNLLINNADLEKKIIEELAISIKDRTKDLIKDYDRLAINRSSYLQLQNLKERSISFDIRLLSYMQMSYEYDFFHINPFNPLYLNYKIDYKRLFIKEAIANESILNTTDNMYLQIKKEEYVYKYGLNQLNEEAVIIMTNDELVSININVVQGSGKFYFDNLDDKELKKQLIRHSIFYLQKIGLAKEATNFDYYISIKKLFELRIKRDVAIGIVYYIMLYLKNLEIKPDKVLMLSSSSRGNIRKIKYRPSILDLLNRLKIREIITSNEGITELNSLIVENELDLNTRGISTIQELL